MWNFGPKLDLGKFEPTIMDFYYIGYAYNQCKCNIFYIGYVLTNVNVTFFTKKLYT